MGMDPENDHESFEEEQKDEFDDEQGESEQFQHQKTPAYLAPGGDSDGPPRHLQSGITGLLSMPSGKPSDYHDVNNPIFSSQAQSYGLQENSQNKEHEQISIDAPASASVDDRSEITAVQNDKGQENRGPYESDREPKRVNIETTQSQQSSHTGAKSSRR